MSWKVGLTTTSLEVVNSILSSALRSIPSAMIAVFSGVAYLLLYFSWMEEVVDEEERQPKATLNS